MMLREDVAMRSLLKPRMSLWGKERAKNRWKGKDDEDSLKITIGRVSIIRNGGIRAIPSVSKTGNFSSFPRIQ